MASSQPRLPRHWVSWRVMDGGIYDGLEPAALWRHFAALNAIPRPSGHEAGARDYVRRVAEAAGAEWLTDAKGNAVVRVAASDGRTGPTIAVQTHLDMVCEAASGVEHDCEHDPIVARRRGDRVEATDTTLGADNGIGVAAALALLSDDVAVHGPLELLFTVEEEAGLHGAIDLDSSMVSANALVNLDSEDQRALTIGCAGAADVRLTLAVEREPTPPGWRGAELRVSGLRGGHSGMRIQEPHANSIKLAATAARALERGGHARVASLEGGGAHNAIPREALVGLALAPDTSVHTAEALVAALYREWVACEPGLLIDLVDTATPAEVFSRPDSDTLLSLLGALPHGVVAMSDRYADTVATSANLAIIRTTGAGVEILTSVRSLSATELAELQDDIAAAGVAVGARAELSAGYPGWEPREHSPLVAATTAAYRAVYGRDPVIQVLHGGLECGVIVAKKPMLEAISFGPLIEGAHTPEEHVFAPSVASTYAVLTALLQSLAGGAA
jgi:dipeptidase D